MARKASPQSQLEQAYKSTFASTKAAIVLTDLVEFSSPEQCKDPQVRAGRLDVIARILKQRGNSIPDTAPSVFNDVQVEE